MSEYDLNEIRKKLKEKSAKTRDSNEFVPKKAESATEADKYRFFILPPVKAGEKVNGGGTAARGMDSFALQHGMHWYQKRPYACPRLIYEEECPLCQTGFDLVEGVDDKKARAKVFQTWMPNQSFYVNIYFPNTQDTPEEYRGRVMYYAAPKTVYDIMYAAIFRDGYGAADDPDGFGAFFDPKHPLLFSLNVKKASGTDDKNRTYNDYKSSKFLVNVDHDSKQVRYGQLAKSDEAVKLILDNRFDLWTKVELPDLEKLGKLKSTILHSISGNGDDGGGFQEEAPASRPAQSSPANAGTVKTGKLATTTPAPAAVVEEAPAEDPVETETGSGGGDADDDEIAGILAKLKKAQSK